MKKIKAFSPIFVIILIGLFIGLFTGAQRFRGVDTATGKPIIVFYHYASGDSLIIDSLAYFDKGVYVNGPLKGDSVAMGAITWAEFQTLDNASSELQSQITSNTTEAEAGAIAGDSAQAILVLAREEIEDSLAEVYTLIASNTTEAEAGAIAGDSAQAILILAREEIEDSLAEVYSLIASNTTEAEAGAIAGDSAQAILVLAREEIEDSLAEVYALIATNADNSLLAIPGTDSTGVGSRITLTAGTALTFGIVVYIGGDSKMEKTDADAAATAQAFYLCLATIAENSAGIFLRSGVARCDAWDWTPGAPLYVSLDTGLITETAISTDGDQLVKIGGALTADAIDFRPDMTIIEHK